MFLYSLREKAINRWTIPIATETLSIFITWSNVSSDTFKTPTKLPSGANRGASIAICFMWNPKNSPVPSPARLAAGTARSQESAPCPYRTISSVSYQHPESK